MIGSQSDRTIFLVCIMISEGKRKHLWICQFCFFTFCHSLAGRRHPNERTRKLLVRPLQRRSLSAFVMSPFVTNALFLICSLVQFSEQQVIYAYPVSDYLHDILNDSSEHPFAHATHCNCLWIRLSMRVNESG